MCEDLGRQEGLAAILEPLREQGASEVEMAEITRRAWEFYQKSQEQDSGRGLEEPR